MSSAPPATAARSRRPDTQTAVTTGGSARVIVLAWLIPGAGHVLVGEARRGLVFFVTLTAMYAIGIGFGGRLFPFQFSEWLVLLAGLAQWGLGLPRLIASIAGAGAGEVVAVTYEYGNTFLIASGLLNMLVALDAFDRARGVKDRTTR